MWVLAAEIVIVEALNPTYDFMKCRHLTGECMSDYIPEDELDEEDEYPAVEIVSEAPVNSSIERERERDFSMTRNRLATHPMRQPPIRLRCQRSGGNGRSGF